MQTSASFTHVMHISCRYRLTGLSGKFVRPQKSMKYEEEPVYGFVRCFIHVAVVMHILCGL